VHRYHPRHWFARLAPADAARFIVAIERVRLNDWTPIARNADGTFVFSWSESENQPLVFGKPGQNTLGAIVALNKQLSRFIVARLRADGACRSCVLCAAAQAMLDDDVELSKGLLRRLIDATMGHEALASLAEQHPKRLIRMLGPKGNPAARHLSQALAHVARWHGVRLTVTVGTRPVRAMR